MQDIHFGKALKELADQKKLGPTEIGRRMGVRSQSIYEIYKTESVGGKMIVKFCNAIGVEPAVVFGRVVMDSLQKNEGEKTRELKDVIVMQQRQLSEKDQQIAMLTQSLRNLTESLGKHSASELLPAA
ncbi:hypothetical protein F5984_18880 [Rudanella paleaurantiibacter]|uniref:Helix-turn-helix domain-containing protein n=1 Tax=Rudanella paleaurantiibacter TaxID=2614655 RepID=A0A7J5TVW4_9BACT|nr:hypothetical protein [Rudanella paleaurantiibacter]KAB7728437.1 hypothetical protein F5984_18880 [Rudanella paleaurantiibacter]